MIVRGKPTFLHVLTAVRGSVLPTIAPQLLGMMAYAAALVWVDHRFHDLPHPEPTSFGVFGIALSLFLGFRNNAAYDRWWEARKLWGLMLANMRALAREAEVFLPEEAARHRLLRLALANLHLHRINLRASGPDAASTAATDRAGLAARARPCDALDAMALMLAEERAAGRLDGFGARQLTDRMADLGNHQAGAERIAVTPLPYVYSLLVFRTSWLYLLIVPLSLIGPAGWMTPLVVGVMAYIFFGFAEVTEELSHPFADTPNALPMSAICRAVEISMAPHLGEEPPPPLLPVDYRLD
ncbi:MAG: bestrophin family protein [Paracoccaceae bacterium]